MKGADNYKRNLTDYRSNVMPPQFNRQFRENPDQNMIGSKLTDLNQRYEHLFNSCDGQYNTLSDLLERLTRYKVSVDGVETWLQEAYDTQGRLMKEPVGAEPEFIKKQIDRVQVCLMKKSIVYHQLEFLELN